MALISETGHAINISNYKKIIDTVDEIGADYNPTNDDIKVATMTSQWEAADAAHQTLTAAVQTAKEPINEREILFNVNPLVTKTINYLGSTNASAQVKKDAKGLADKFRGFGIKVKLLPDGTPDPADVSNSHLSFVMKQDSFKQLVDLYGTITLYDPNENALKITALTTLRDAMKASNDAIGTIIAPVSMARVTRDNVLYKVDTGIVDVSLKCKKYVRSFDGAQGARSKLVSAIKVKRLKKIV